jgi:predicted  nucleic acid-binding Zn-ribbon protein
MQKSSLRVHGVPLLLLMAGMALVPGCDQRSQGSKSLQSASNSLHATGVAPEADASKLQSRLKQISGSLADVAANGSAGEKSSAAVLLAQTTMGEGELAAQAAKTADFTIRNQLVLVSGLLADWSRHSATVNSLKTFDPSKDLAELDAGKAAMQSELESHEKALAAAKARQSQLQDEAKAKMVEAEAAAREYATRSQSAIKMTATQAAEVVIKANEFRRQADDLRTAGGKLQAAADLLEPTVKEYGVLGEKCRRQIANYEKSAESLRTRRQASEQESAAAAAKANAAANDLDKMVVELLAKRASDVVPAYAKAADHFAKAASKAAGAAAAAPGMSKVSQGSAKLALAETHWGQSHGARAVISTLDALAGVRPALPQASQYKAKAEELRAEAKTSLETAAAALEEAKSAFESARISDKAVKERLTMLAEQVGKAKDIAGGASIEPPSAPVETPAAGSGAAAGGSAPAATAAVDPALLEAVDRALEATRTYNTASLIDSAVGIDDEGKALLRKMAAMTDAMGAVDKACREKFGKSVNEVLASNPMMGQALKGMGGAIAVGDVKAADLTFKVEGDKATATMPGSPMPMQFAKHDGKWVPDMSGQAAMLPMLKGQMGMIEQFGGVIKTWGDDIAAGKFADANAAAQGLQQAFMPIMQQMMGGGRRNGGG